MFIYIKQYLISVIKGKCGQHVIIEGMLLLAFAVFVIFWFRQYLEYM